jgi:hypothetical protein
MVTDKQMNDVLITIYQNFMNDIDSYLKAYTTLENSERISVEQSYMTGTVYGLELAQSAFLWSYKKACMTKKT